MLKLNKIPDMKKVMVKKPSGTSKSRFNWVDEEEEEEEEEKGDVVFVVFVFVDEGCLEGGVNTTPLPDDDSVDRGNTGTNPCVVVVVAASIKQRVKKVKGDVLVMSCRKRTTRYGRYGRTVVR